MTGSGACAFGATRGASIVFEVATTHTEATEATKCLDIRTRLVGDISGANASNWTNIESIRLVAGCHIFYGRVSDSVFVFRNRSRN